MIDIVSMPYLKLDTRYSQKLIFLSLSSFDAIHKFTYNLFKVFLY